MIKNLVEQLDEEIEDAQKYAEKYVECKAKGNIQRANRYKEMASDELRHSSYIHEMAVKDIEELKKVYTAPIEMQEKWDAEHKRYVERVAIIKQMLTL
jgi:hypothetical protein